MAAPPAGARPYSSAAVRHNIKHGRNLGCMCAICEPGGGPEDGVLSGWMVTLVNEPADAAALPPPACSARELVRRASAEGFFCPRRQGRGACGGGCAHRE